MPLSLASSNSCLRQQNWSLKHSSQLEWDRNCCQLCQRTRKTPLWLHWLEESKGAVRTIMGGQAKVPLKHSQCRRFEDLITTGLNSQQGVLWDNEGSVNLKILSLCPNSIKIVQYQGSALVPAGCGESQKCSETAASCEKEPGLRRTRTSCFLTMCR